MPATARVTLSARLARAAAGGTRPCSSGTISPPTANWARSRASANARGRALPAARRSRPARRRDYTFLLAWHFPTARRRGAAGRRPRATKTRSSATTTATRFADAWEAAEYAAAEPARAGEADARSSPRAMRESTLPGAVKDAAMANLSTLVTHHLLPHRRRRVPRLRRRQRQVGLLLRQLHARVELRDRHRAPVPLASRARCAKPPSATRLDDAGAMHFRQTAAATARSAPASRPPTGRWARSCTPISTGSSRATRSGCAACGRASRRRSSSPGCPAAGTPTATACWKACSTTPTTWSSTGRTRMCGIYYLGALRAGEEMARAVGDAAVGGGIPPPVRERQQVDRRQPVQRRVSTSRRCAAFAQGQDRARRCAATWASEDTENPEYQVGDGCLVDQLVGQYLADVGGPGPAGRPRDTSARRCESIYRYNYKRTLADARHRRSAPSR